MAEEETPLQNQIKFFKPQLSLSSIYIQDFSELISNVIYKDNDNSFSLQYKLYYGIIGSSAIGSNILVENFTKKFIAYGGDTSWVEEGKNCEKIPKHIKGFAKMNDILVHKPWILFWAHFAEFDNGMTFFLFQSAIILTTIHRYATIFSWFQIFKNSNNTKETAEDNETISETKNEEMEKAQSPENKKDENIIKNLKEKFILNPIVHTDFDPHTEKYLLTEDFDWKTNAKYFFSDYAQKEMDFLEQEFKSLDSIPYDESDENNILKKKNAIEKYVGLILGIKDNSYDYHNTNKHLSKYLKALIKKIVCSPEKLYEETLQDLLIIIKEKENLIRLIFLVTAIKQKICLTFFAKAFDDFSSNKNKSNLFNSNENNLED